MLASLLKRPSAYVVLCAVVVVSAFVVRGDLRIESDPSARRGAAASPADPIVRRNSPAPERAMPPVMVAGRVLDALGHAVSGARVTGTAGAIAVTGSDGRFHLSLSGETFGELAVHAVGYRAERLRASLSSPDPLTVQLEVAAPWDAEAALLPSPTLVGEGTVRSSDGKPVSGAYVTAVGSGVWSRTDEIGRYTLPLLVGNPTLLAQKDDTAARSQPLALSRTRGVVPLPELVLESASTIRGVLSDAAGNPVEGAPVVIAGEGMSRVCESGQSGRYLVRGLLPGRYEVTPQAWSGALGRSHSIVLDRVVFECNLQLELLVATKVQVCRENGSPVEGSYVAVFLEGARRSVTRADGAGWAEVSVASNGVRFEVRGEDGKSEMAVRRFDSEQARLVVAAP